MRVTSDALDGPPAHGISPGELREALNRLPAEWTGPVKFVRLSASMKSWEIASFSVSSRSSTPIGRDVTFVAQLQEI